MKIYKLYHFLTGEEFYFKTKKKAQKAALEIYLDNVICEDSTKSEIKISALGEVEITRVTVK